ncbi:MAG: hypothetical protein QOD99_2259 [Chthoniobacter sp.]|jgi:hypothetical protein|nr:hypothetical protein [Chthoniobacter sp.]
MANDDQPERIWDEYDWERFLQQQDQKTERYMELLEKHMDDPERDQIIAREMGWHHLLDEDEIEDIDSRFSEEMKALEDTSEDEPDFINDPESFEMHPLYQASFALTVWIDQLFDEIGDVQNHPAAVKLATQSAIASAKLAAALSDDDVDELGMTIAYLKRALKAITNAMEAGAQLKKEIRLKPERYATLQHRLFQIRDRIIALMGEFRSEWRRRYGA